MEAPASLEGHTRGAGDSGRKSGGTVPDWLRPSYAVISRLIKTQEGGADGRSRPRPTTPELMTFRKVAAPPAERSVCQSPATGGVWVTAREVFESLRARCSLWAKWLQGVKFSSGEDPMVEDGMGFLNDLLVLGVGLVLLLSFLIHPRVIVSCLLILGAGYVGHDGSGLLGTALGLLGGGVLALIFLGTHAFFEEAWKKYVNKDWIDTPGGVDIGATILAVILLTLLGGLAAYYFLTK